MGWICDCCDEEVPDKYDYCPSCEGCGCTPDNRRCNEEDPA